MVNDNRINLQAPLIDFTTNVGLTGQSHDDFPAPGSQARFDHFRIFLIGLLACQSSENEPTQYREGTWWFDMNTETMKIRKNNAWVSASNVIQLDVNEDSSPLSLQDWYNEISTILSSIQNDIFFRCDIVSSGISSLPIPGTLQNKILPSSIALVYVNGILIDPLEVTFNSPTNPTVITLPNLLSSGDVVTVIIKYIPSDKLSTQVQTI